MHSVVALRPSIHDKFSFVIERIHRSLSRASDLPLVSRLRLPPNRVPTPEERAGYLACQRLAQSAVVEVAGLLREGWTEVHAATMIETYLRDHGVTHFFHKPYAWFGNRSSFQAISTYADFMPTQRKLRENESFILDVAPILEGFVSDIGFSGCCGENDDFDRALSCLKKLREAIPSLFVSAESGADFCKQIADKIAREGYDSCHHRYPFSVLGHRVYRVARMVPELNLLGFGWQSFWSLLSRGLFGQLLNERFEGDRTGLWAIEPHIGTATFGAKFEEILVCEKSRAYWLEDKGCSYRRPS